METSAIEAHYRDLLGGVPENVRQRQALAAHVGRGAAIEAVEALRQELLHRNPLDRRVQQLVHFAMLIGAGEEGPARLHARAAYRAGASLADLFGVCETAAVVGGRPSFSRAVAIVYALWQELEPTTKP
ncbi:MAG: carboxymuconolactone decarboxylase family protein [Hymenobacter sp.]|nr:carboxymuconolactone decarboxylase family protein [Hymenobacter sp.]